MTKKTINLYKYVSTEHLKQIVEEKRIKLSDGKNFNDPFELIKIDSKTKEELRIDGLRILCLTNSFRKKLMWSHYANSHKGVCLTLSVPKELVYPVCYTSRRITTTCDIDEILNTGLFCCKKNLIRSFNGLSNNQKCSLVKDKKWIYEKEYRIVLQENSRELVDNWFLPIEIKNIYLGVNFSENENSNELMETFKKNQIPLTQVTRSRKNYSLELYKIR